MIDWTKPIETVDGREALKIPTVQLKLVHVVYTLPDPDSCGSKHDVFLVDDSGCRCDGRAIYSKSQEPFIRNVAEVYISDTPSVIGPSFIQPLNGPNGPLGVVEPDLKTLRDEFAMALMDADDFMVGFKEHAEQLYRAADAMMEARKK